MADVPRNRTVVATTIALVLGVGIVIGLGFAVLSDFIAPEWRPVVMAACGAAGALGAVLFVNLMHRTHS